MKPILWITFYLPNDLAERLKPFVTIKMWQDERYDMPQDEFETAVLEADYLWTIVPNRLTADVLQRTTKLKMITNLAVGFNNIDVEAAKEKGIIVTNTPDVLAETTADLAFALLLASARHMIPHAKQLYEGKWTGWQVFGMTGTDVHHKTLGIVGMGAIGELVAKRASGFDMNVLYHNRNRKEEAERAYGVTYCSKEALFKQADFIVLLTPLTEETHHLIDREAFTNMKNSAYVINVARGGIVDEEALYDALVNGSIAGAASDVFVEEPVSTDHPLLSLPNFTPMPHIGSATIETRQAMVERNLEAWEAYFTNQSIPYRVI